jgi:cytoskeleton protein RodZ
MKRNNPSVSDSPTTAARADDFRVAAPPAATQAADPLAFFGADSEAKPGSVRVETSSLSASIPSAEALRGADAQATPLTPALIPESLAARLTAARDARGWSRSDVAQKLRLPEYIVQSIEAEQYDRIGQGIYLRGYLTSYARLVGVPVEAIDSVLSRQVVAEPQLVATGRISHSRYLFERYSGSAVYILLTAVLVVPLVWSAMATGNRTDARLTPLDVSAPMAATTDAGRADTAATDSADATQGAAQASGMAPLSAATSAPAPNNESPLMASFALVPNRAAADAAHLNGAGANNGLMRLSLNEASWVEIVDADGKRLEYATLPAGTVKTYTSDKPLTVLLGNTVGATLDVNGVTQDIAPYNRGNVARFRLFAAGKPIAAAGDSHSG